ncbi:Hypothetical protein D9617_4g001230 [Elsinoe fawcettii]|nr:Hypothetical protein D9617_4g001230 [Elsinoe fawcettii]
MPSAAQDKVYRRGQGVRQQHFGDIKTTKKPKPSLSRRQSSVVKIQSTLTQIEYCTPLSSLAKEDDGDDSDYPEGPKRKKRKSKHLSLAQKTLTQMLSSPGPPINYEEISHGHGDTIQETQWQPLPGTEESADEHVVHSTPRTIRAESEADRTPGKRDASEELDAIKDSPMTPTGRAVYAQLISRPNTTAKYQDREIPETPQSVSSPLTIREGGRLESESPLKIRSVIKSPQIVISTQHSSYKGDEAGRVSPGPKHRVPMESQTISPIPFRKPLLPARCTQARGGHVGSPSKPPRLIVEDSQVDDFGETLQDYVIESTYVPNSGHNVFEASYLQPTQRPGSSAQHSVSTSVYDPIMSALNRDEDRFGETQRRVNGNIFDAEEKQTVQGHIGLDGVWDQVEVPPPGHSDAEDEVQEPRAKSTETIDLTSDAPGSHVGTPTSTPVSPAQPDRRDFAAPTVSYGSTDLRLPRPSQATTVGEIPSNPPSPSRIPQTYMPKSSPPPLLTSSPPPGPISSSPQLGTLDRPPPRSSFTPYTYAEHGYAEQLDWDNDEDPTPERDSRLAEPGEARRRLRRLKRGEEVLPDSLLDFTIPTAPPWTSSPPRPQDDEDDEEVIQAADGENEDGVACKDFGNVDLGIDLSSSPPAVQKDYSLDPPSSDWRSSGRSRR